MARPRKPTQLHVVSGTAKVHPERMREREAEPTLDGFDLRDMEAPDHLDEMHAKLWNEIRGHLHARTSGEQDIVAFEALVRLVMVMRLGRAVAADYARLQAYLGEFGMTPASRSKVAQGKKAEQKKGFGALKAAG
jgi:phage terminase small subunit